MIIAGTAILVVEDEPIIAFTLEDMLLTGGAAVAIACSLPEAEAALARDPIDIAILDVNVHGHNSYGFARMLRDRAIPFIFATGYGGSTHPDDFAGVPTIAKPYALADIELAFAAFA